jgi:hypothetical protein
MRNEELNNLYNSPNFIRLIKSRKMNWAKSVERYGENRGAYKSWVGRPEQTELMEDTGEDEMMLKWIVMIFGEVHELV